MWETDGDTHVENDDGRTQKRRIRAGKTWMGDVAIILPGNESIMLNIRFRSQFQCDASRECKRDLTVNRLSVNYLCMFHGFSQVSHLRTTISTLCITFYKNRCIYAYYIQINLQNHESTMTIICVKKFHRGVF